MTTQQTVVETEIYNQTTVADVLEYENLKQVCSSLKINYQVPGITDETTSDVSLSIVNTSLFNEDVCGDDKLTKLLMNVTTNSVLIHHISNSIRNDYEEACNGNPDAKEYYDSLQQMLDSFGRLMTSLVIKVG